jgi:tetratricopeptide (TPR) repeat protein
MMKLDRFDIINLAIAALLAGAAVFYGIVGGAGGTRPRAAYAKICAAVPSPELIQKVEAARLLLEAGQVKESVGALSALEAANPASGEVHALLGQGYSRLMDYHSAVREFRLALLIEPDYIDSKSPRFIGKRIKAAVREGKPEFTDALRKDPGNDKAAAALNDAKYLERMLAGGCE